MEIKATKELRITLKAARVNANLTQRNAAQRIGVCVATLQNYEAGNTVPDWDTVHKIEIAYNIPADNIIFARDYA